MTLYFMDYLGMLPAPTPEQEEKMRPLANELKEIAKSFKVLLVDADHLHKTGKIRYV